MKFEVLFLFHCATFVARCMAKTSDSKSYLTEAASTSTWAGWTISRCSILFLILPCAVLYYIPQSRSYARKGCHVAIDLVANGLKAALSGSLSSPNCYEAGCLSFSSKRFANPVNQDFVVSTNAQKEQINASNIRRRHRVKQESKVEEEKTRVQDRRRHRRNERTKCPREDKNMVRHGQSAVQRNQSQSVPKTSSGEPETRTTPSPTPHFYQERKTTGFYYPGTRNEDETGPEYSTSFVTSDAKTRSTLEEEYPQTVSKHRSRPSRRSRIEDSLYPENDGPTRDCESFLLTELKDCLDSNSKVVFGTTTVDCPEKEGAGISSREEQPRRDSASNIQEFEVADGSQSVKIENVEIDDCGNEEIAPARTSETLVKDSTVERTAPLRKVNFQKKHKDRGIREFPEGRSTLFTEAIAEADKGDISSEDENAAVKTKSEEVLGQLGDQIAKLEKTIRMMKPGDVSRKERGQSSSHTHDYALRNIETVIKDMKRSFGKVDERIKRRRRSTPDREEIKGRSRRPPRTAVRDVAESLTSVVDEEVIGVDEKASSEIGEDDSAPSRTDLTIFHSETLLDEDEELAPIVTNRVKPYLIRTFDWLFTGCPGACGEKKHGVGKGGDLRTGAEWIP